MQIYTKISLKKLEDLILAIHRANIPHHELIIDKIRNFYLVFDETDYKEYGLNDEDELELVVRCKSRDCEYLDFITTAKEEGFFIECPWCQRRWRDLSEEKTYE